MNKFLVVIIFLASLMAGCDSKQPDNQYEKLNLTSAARPLTEAEAGIVSSLKTIPDYYWETVAADLDGDGHDEIIVLVQELDYAMMGKEEPCSGIVNIEAGKVRYRYRFPANQMNAFPLVSDFDGNGVLDLVFTSANGGNCFECSSDLVVWWDGNAFRHQDIGEMKEFYDLEGDGALELETTFEMDEAGHGAMGCETVMAAVRGIQYASSTVWGWRDGVLCDISAEIPEFYRDVRLPALASQRLEMENIKKEIDTEEFDQVVDCLLKCFEMVDARAKVLAEGHPWQSD